MASFPPGGWSIDGIEDVVDWAKEFRQLEPTKSLRQIDLELRKLSAEIAAVTQPLEMDDYSSLSEGGHHIGDDKVDDDDDDELPIAPVAKDEKGKGSIRVSRKAAAPARGKKQPDAVVIDPPVRSYNPFVS
jgi:hypothetical protein